ncbi:hypothetical protein HRbin05_00547 [archaeon HR05]|nr:hypothetical protein HRbin05_00547 [archaeon HR05]
MDDAGLNATLSSNGIPLLSPPSMPPALLLVVTTLPSFTVYGSLFSEPLTLDPWKPDPNSTPLTAGIENNALLRSDSNAPNIGSPNPMGMFNAIHSTTPPRESPSCLALIIASLISSAVLWSGHLTSLLYLNLFASIDRFESILIPPISRVYAITSMPSV